MPEPTDIIVLEPGEDGWTYRYAAHPDQEADQRLHGYTFCCGRAIAVPWDSGHLAPTLNVNSNWPLIDDCCERPFSVHGHKPVDLPPYSGEHATCRKCGSKAVETQYKGPGVVAHRLGASSMTESMLAPNGYPKEWLARRCAVCQATWDEATIPAPGGAPDERRPYTYGLRRPRITDLHGHYPYETVAGERIRDAVDAARALAGPKPEPLERGTELVRRQRPGDPWEAVLVADGQYGWIEPAVGDG